MKRLYRPVYAITALSSLTIGLSSACGAPERHHERHEPHHHRPDDNTPSAEGHGHAGHAVAHLHHDHSAETKGHLHHDFDDPERWSKIFDAPERDAWQLPDAVVAEVLGGRQDLTLVDLGSGTGYFSLRFARALTQGRVYAVDIAPRLVSHSNDRAKKAGLDNHHGIYIEDPTAPLAGLPEGTTPDIAFACNTYHHFPDRVAYFKHVHRHLASDGQVVIVDFRPESPRGPHADHKLPATTVDAELIEAGFTLVRHWDGLPDQYVLIYRKSDSP